MMEEGEGEEQPCRVQPSAWFLLATLALTAAATALLCAAIMTDQWERLRWDRAAVDRAAHNSSRVASTEWLMDGRAARILAAERRGAAIFLVPMHGGIWTLCVSLSEDEMEMLQRIGFTKADCVNYLAPDTSKAEEGKADWQHRMQNLSISCALVCLIILGSAALVGAFGVFTHQISAVLVTGVMYLLAATFALFTLTILHFKRHQVKSRPENRPLQCDASSTAAMLVDGVFASAAALHARQTLDGSFLAARLFSSGWSMELGWGGVALCLLASVFWILLSKIMRYSPISTLVS